MTKELASRRQRFLQRLKGGESLTPVGAEELGLLPEWVRGYLKHRTISCVQRHLDHFGIIFDISKVSTAFDREKEEEYNIKKAVKNGHALNYFGCSTFY